MKKRQLFVSSMLTILMSASLLAGATYSLFTSESTHDITVSSGTVNVESSILDDLVLKSMDKPQTGSFANGGLAQIEGNTLKLTNITPGDEVIFKLQISNKSTVKIKYRIVLRCASGPELFSGLIITPDINQGWDKLEVDPTPETPTPKIQEVSVKLPSTAGNEYKGLTSTILISVEAVQGNVKDYNPSNPKYDSIEDQVTVNKLNHHLKSVSKVPATMSEVADALITKGVNLEELTTKATDTFYLWDQDTNSFVIADNTNTVTYPVGVTTPNEHLWKVVDAYDDSCPYSQYLKDNAFSGPDLTLSVDTGLDLGKNKEEFDVTYNGTSNSNLIVNTNTAGTDLTVNTAQSEISHYGPLGKLTISEVPLNCYFEYGKTSYAEINKGKAVIKDGGEISLVLVEPIAEAKVLVTKEPGAIVNKAYASSQAVAEAHEGIPLDFSKGAGEVKLEGQATINTAKEEEKAASELTIRDAQGVTNSTLVEFRDSVNRGDSYKGKTVTLLKDIDLKDITSWTPIGTEAHPFNGVFDGNNKTIKNMNIKAVGTFGLFGSVVGDPNTSYAGSKSFDSLWDGETFNDSLITEDKYTAVIKNLTLVNAKTEVVAVADNVNRYQAAVVALPTNTYIKNVHVTSSDIQYHKYGGTIAGKANNTIFNDVSNSSDVIARNNVANVVDDDMPSKYKNSGNSGGLIGRTDGSCVVMNSTNNAQFVLGKGYGGFGGIVGYGQPCVFYNVINNSDIIFDEDARPSYIGGIQGYSGSSSLVINTTNNGNIYANTDEGPNASIGGIYGFSSNSASYFYNCFNKGNIEGSTRYMGGLAGICMSTVSPKPQFVNTSSTGTLTNHRVDGRTNEFNGYGHSDLNIKDRTFQTTAALQEAITRTATEYYGVHLENVTVVDATGDLVLPSTVTSIVSDTKICNTINFNNPDRLVTLTISIPDTNYEISKDLSNMNIKILVDGTTVNVTSTGKANNLSVIGTGAKVNVTGSSITDEKLNRLILGGEGTTATINKDTLIGGVSVTSLGQVTLNNYGKISKVQNNGNTHTISSVGEVQKGARSIIINNHGIIESKSEGKEASYTFLFYKGTTATLNAYAGSKVIAAHVKSGDYLIALNGESHFNVNYVDGTTYQIKEKELTWDKYYKNERMTVTKVESLPL